MKRPAYLLPFELEPQAGHLQWWAAVAVSLQRFYGHLPVPSQHAFARALMGERCDRVCAPPVALAHAGLVYDEAAGPLSPSALRSAFAAGHPVPACMRHFVGWHLVVLYGIDAENAVSVADPLYGRSTCAFPTFAAAYRDHYAWSHSYRYRAPTAIRLA